MQQLQKAIFNLTEEQIQEKALAISASADVPVEVALRGLRETLKEEVWMNDTYQVNVRRGLDYPIGKITHLSIKRLDKQPITDWRDKQEIKNQLVGKEHEAVELYPAESRLVDTANQFHLWVFEDASTVVPVGWTERRVQDHATNEAGVVQRKFDEKKIY